MGCFNLKGFLSRVTIQRGDDIVLMIGLQKLTNTQQFYTCEGIVPLTLPIYGKYDDYGGIEDVEDTTEARWIEKHLGKINDVVDAISECMSQFRQTIGKCKNSDNEYHPETKIRYVYDNFLKLKSYLINEESRLCLLIEHRSVYDKYGQLGLINENDDYHGIKTIIEEFKKRSYILDFLAKEDEIWDLFNIPKLFGNESYGILCIHNHDKNFLLDNTEELKKLQGFIWAMEFIGHSIQIPMQYTQEDYFSSELEYHQMCIDLINQLKKEHDWYEDEEDE